MKDAAVWQKLWRTTPIACCLFGLWGLAFGQGDIAPEQAKSPRPSPVSAAAEWLSSPPGRPLLEPGHVKVTVFASPRKGLKGRYIYSPLVSYVSDMVFAPDGSLYFFDVSKVGGDAPLVKITPEGKVAQVARPEFKDPDFGPFGPIAISSDGRVYVLYREPAEIKADGKIHVMPLRNEQGKKFSGDGYPSIYTVYPNLWYFAVGLGGQLYVTDRETVWRIGRDYVLRPLKYSVSELPTAVRMGLHLWGGVEGYSLDGAIVAPGGCIYAVGLKLLSGGKFPPPGQQVQNLYRIGDGGRPDLRRSARVELLVSAKDMPGEGEGAIAMDRDGSLYVSTRNTIYKISPQEESK